MPPASQPVSVSALVAFTAAALSFATGFTLIRGQPGLERQHFANSPSWEGSSEYSDVAAPELARRSDVRALASRDLFSLRWLGWLTLAEEGVYRFSLSADERAYLTIDGTEVVSNATAEHRRAAGRRRLSAGTHTIEVGLSQTGGESHLQLRWARPRQEWQPLPSSVLYAHRAPGGIDRAVRSLTGHWPPLVRRLASALLLSLAAFLVFVGLGKLRLGAPSAAWRERAKRLGHALFYPALFAGTYLASFPLTARTLAGDDIRYLDAAYFSKKLGWILNRYAHIDLVRGFLWLAGGDPYLASRIYWSAMLAATVVALAVACRALGPRLQIRTFAVALFLLLAQAHAFATAGGAFADYTVMMLVTMAVAIYLHGESAGRPEPGRTPIEWHALAIGALTVWAVKSKETGIILAALPLLFLWSNGRLDWQRFRRRAVFCLSGALAAYAVLMLLDWHFLGDPWFSLRPESLAALERVSLVEEGAGRRFSLGWLELAWPSHPARAAQRHLWMLVAAAALAAFFHRRPQMAGTARNDTARLLLHLLPLAFLAMMVVLHGRAVYTVSSRHLIPIVGVAALCGAMLAHRLGLEEIRWRSILSARVLVPALLVAAATLFVLAPYSVGELAEGELPSILARALDGGLVTWVFGAALVATLVPTIPPRARLFVLLLALLAAFGPGFERTRSSLSRKIAVQRSDRILYPWDAFGDQLRGAKVGRILISRKLIRDYGMGGNTSTRSRIARLYLRRGRVRVDAGTRLEPAYDFAVGAREDLARWRPTIEAQGRATSFDPGKLLVLVHPPGSSVQEAARQ